MRVDCSGAVDGSHARGHTPSVNAQGLYGARNVEWFRMPTEASRRCRALWRRSVVSGAPELERHGCALVPAAASNEGAFCVNGTLDFDDRSRLRAVTDMEDSARAEAYEVSPQPSSAVSLVVLVGRRGVGSTHADPGVQGVDAGPAAPVGDAIPTRVCTYVGDGDGAGAIHHRQRRRGMAHAGPPRSIDACGPVPRGGVCVAGRSHPPTPLSLRRSPTVQEYRTQRG
jgi:hypothetical protein